MRTLRSYTSISLDGFFTDAKGDMSWAHKRDDEWNAFASSNASGERCAPVRPRHLRADEGLLAHAAGRAA